MKARLLFIAAATLALGGCVRPLAQPAWIEPPAGQTHVMTVAAKGVQIYECRAADWAFAPPVWVLVAPDAELFDAASGRRIGHHGAGPHWQAEDGSRVVGKLRARSPAPDPSAIPWLLLDVVEARPAGSAEGLFSRIASIQRVNTVGGLPPGDICTKERIGTPARSPYSADYRFYAAAAR